MDNFRYKQYKLQLQKIRIITVDNFKKINVYNRVVYNYKQDETSLENDAKMLVTTKLLIIK